ncbi:MAG: hypothetical protein JWN17_702 [Frankiales bacterium]|nr:hypothetical protein [Frankiales bacterium]
MTTPTVTSAGPRRLPPSRPAPPAPDVGLRAPRPSGRARSNGPAPLPDLDERRKVQFDRLRARQSALLERTRDVSLKPKAEVVAGAVAAQQRVRNEGQVLGIARRLVGTGLKRTGKEELKGLAGKAGEASTAQAQEVGGWERPGLADDTRPLTERASAELDWRDVVHTALMSRQNIDKTRARAAELLRENVRDKALDRVIGEKVLGHLPVSTLLAKAESTVVERAQTAALRTVATDPPLQRELARVRERLAGVTVSMRTPAAHTARDEELFEEVGQEALSLAERFEDRVTLEARQAAIAQAQLTGRPVVKQVKRYLEGDKSFRDGLKKQVAERTVTVLEAGPVADTHAARERASDLADAKAKTAATLENGAMGTQAGILSKAVDKLVPRVGDEAALDLELRVNGGGWYVGFQITGKLEKDDDTDPGEETTSSAVLTRGTLVVAVTGGGELPGGGSAGAKAGFFIEAASRDGAAGLAQLVSYGLYRQFRESRVPREFQEALWGLGGATAAVGQLKCDARHFEAETWSRFVETALQPGDEYWSGLAVGVGAEGGKKGVVDVKGSAQLRTGTYYDKATVDNARGHAAPTTSSTSRARGPAPSSGLRRTKLETELSAEAGPFAGALEADLTWTGPKLTGVNVIGTLSATIPTAVASPGDIALKVADAAAKIGPQVQKALVKSRDEAAAKKKATADVDPRAPEIAAFEEGAVEFGKQALDVLDVPLQSAQSGAIGALSVDKDAAASYVSDLKPDDAVVGLTTTLSLSGRFSRSRDVTLGPAGITGADPWTTEAVLELRHEKGLELGLPGLASMSFSRSSRLLRLKLYPRSAPEKATGTPVAGAAAPAHP